MTHLKVGDKAPDFSGIDQHGNTVKMADFSGKKILLFFYPKASTPGCTDEAKNLRDNYGSFIENGYAVIGVSADSQKRQLNFCTKNELPFPLIADENLEIIKSYGVWGPKKMMGREYEGIYRSSFVISENGTLQEVITKVDTKNHSSQILFKSL